MSESSPEVKDEIQSLAQEAVESCPEVSKQVEDKSLDLEEENDVKSDQLKDSQIESPKTHLDQKPASIEQLEKEPKPDVPTEEVGVPTEEMGSLRIADKSPIGEPLKSEERGREAKPKSETPNKSRSRARSIANVFESPYNTRLKVKLMKEREQRSLSEDSGKRDAN